MAVRLRMKRMGRRHRPYFRVVAGDGRAASDGKVIEYLGNYDPMLTETDARATLKNERIDYGLSVGAQPSDKVGVLIKKYGTNGTHLQQQQALQRLAVSKPIAPPPVAIPEPKVEEPAVEATEATETAEAAESTQATGTEEAPAEKAQASEGETEETKE